MKKAAALKYDPNRQSAPKVVASGKGAVAEAIVAKAREYGVALFANSALVESLLELQIDSEIPVELYETVVELFVWLARADEAVQHDS